MLRLTNDVMHAIPGYAPDATALPMLLEWFDVLDRGWLAVLRVQAWDPAQREGVNVLRPAGKRASPVNQTERTRLRSLLVTGTGNMEEWLEGLSTEEGYGDALERLGLQQGFDDLFSRTLSEMGGLGEAANNPEGMIGTW